MANDPGAPRPGRLPVLLCVLFVAALLPARAAPGASGEGDLAERALAAYSRGAFAESAELFLKAIEAGDDGPDVRYNAACSLARAGQASAALTQLEKAVALGYSGVDHMKSDPDLENVRGDPRWVALLEQASRALAALERRWAGQAFRTPYQPSLSEAEKQAGLSRVWAEARFGFANFDLAPADLDWDARYLEFIPRVRAARTTAEYYREPMAFMALLHDGHTGVTVPDELRDAFTSRPALRTARIEGRVVVMALLDPALSELGVHAGDEVVSVDGRPVADHARERVLPYQSASTPQDLDVRVYDYALLTGPPGDPVVLGLRTGDGAVRSVSLPRLTREQQRPFRKPPFELTWEAGDVAYVQLRSFNSPDAADQWAARFDEVRARAKGVVLDVRENGGGNTGVGFRILGTLIEKPYEVGSYEMAVYRATLLAWQRPQRRDRPTLGSLPPSDGPHYAGPVAVLIGPRTYSAAEDFAVAFDVTGRGPMIGTPTGGSTGQPLKFDLPGGGSARVCSKRDRYADGKEFVGVGVQPDILVAPTVESVRAGRDPELERALEWVRRPRP